MQSPEAEHEASLLENIQEQRDGMIQNRLARTQAETLSTEMELERDEAEIKRMEMQARRMELSEHLKSLRGETGNNSSEVMITMMEILREQANEARALAGTRDKSSSDPQLAGVLGEMTQTLADLRRDVIAGQAKGDRRPTEEIQESLQALASIKGLMAELGGATGNVAVSSAERDIEVTLRMHEIDLTHAREMAKIDLERARWQDEKDLKHLEIEAETQKAAAYGAGLGNLLETFAPVLQEVAGRFGGGVAAPVGMSMPAAYPYTEPQEQVFAVNEPTQGIAPSSAAQVVNGRTPLASAGGHAGSMDCPSCQTDLTPLIATMEGGSITCRTCGATSYMEQPQDFVI